MGRAEVHDIAVIGLGAMGAMTMWQAARAAGSVIGFEQFTPGHDRGSSHGGSRIFRRVVPEGPAYVPLIRRADALWHALERESGQRLREVTGGLTIGTAQSAAITGALAAARAGGVEVDLLDTATLRTRYPQHAALDDDVAVFEPGAGVVHPEHAIRAAVDLAVQHGAEIRTDEQIRALHPIRDGVAVETDTGRTHARRVVIATGAWLTDLLPELDSSVRAQRSVPSMFVDAGPSFGPERFPVFTRRSRHLIGWGVPDVDGGGVKIGVGRAPKPWLRRPEHNWVAAGAADLDLVQEYCVEALPGLAGRTPHAHPCMNSRTPDRNFLIGPSRAIPDVVVLGGFSGHGFKYASAVGEIGAALALGRPAPVPVDAFALDRLDALTWAEPFSPVLGD